MSRWVLPVPNTLKRNAGEPGDTPLDRIIKYVPTEVVTTYTLLFTALVTFKLAPAIAQQVTAGLIGLFLIVAFIYVARQAPAGAVRLAHLIVSPIAFLAWAYPISSAMLGTWFVSYVAFAAQALVIALTMIIVPAESS